MSATIPLKRLILRAVLRDVSPMVARLISVSDDTELSEIRRATIGRTSRALQWGKRKGGGARQ
jgi:hypothetical protein